MEINLRNIQLVVKNNLMAHREARTIKERLTREMNLSVFWDEEQDPGCEGVSAAGPLDLILVLGGDGTLLKAGGL